MSTQFEAKVNNQENLYASIANKDGHISICTLYNTTTIPLNAPYAQGCQLTVDMTGDVFINTSAYGATPVFTVVSTGGASGAVNTVFGRTGTVVAQSGDYAKGDVGLGNVDNTSDADKPVSTAQALVNTAKADKTTTISAGIGISGGGDLSANTSLAMDINGLAEETSIDGAADFIPIYDASNTIIKKVKPNNLPSSGGSGWGLTGNAGTTAGTNFIGTTDGQDVVIKRASIESGRISDSLQSTSFGILSLAQNTAIRNTAFGYNALPVNISGNSNTAVGRSALATNTASGNTAIGSNALTTNSTGTDNIAIGKSAFQMNDTGLSNTIIGTSTGNDLVSGDYNTIIGANVSGLNSTDSSQVIISEGQGNIRFWAKSNGSTAVGTGTLTSPTTGAALEIQGTLGGLRHPILTTTERTALANLAGNVVYDTTLSSLYVNDGTTWAAVGGGGGSSPIIASARMTGPFISIGLVGADVIFNVTDIDTNTAFNTTTGIFTAPTTGNYLISSQVTLDTVLLSGGDSLQMSILRNGTSVAKDTLLINNGAIESSSSLSQSRIISLTAGQTIGVSVSKSSGTVNIVANGGFETYISITSL